MTEVVFIARGEGRVIVDGHAHPVGPGVCLRIDPGETHVVEAGPAGSLELLYFGVIPGPRGG